MTVAYLDDPVPFTGEVHPFADRFPMLPDEELDALADDIAENGLLHPIVLDADGRLIDGRNRLAACGLAGVKPAFVVHDGNAAALIVSANVRRRQMVPGQQAMAEAIGLVERGLRHDGRWKRGALEDMHSGVHRNTMSMAGTVLDYDAANDTDYADQVLIGSLTLTEAHQAVKKALRFEQDARDAAAHARVEAERAAAKAREDFAWLQREAPDLAELVRLQHLSMDEARGAYEKRNAEEIAARQEALNAWNEAVDGLTRCLAYFRNGFTPPDDIPDHRPQVSDLLDRIEALTGITKEYRNG